MPVDPLNPASPVLSDPVQITEELRAIKQRLLLDKNNIETLQSSLVVLTSMGAFGEATLQLDDLAEWATLVQQSAVGKTLFEAASIAAVQTFLGITSSAPTISIGANKTCIQFAGGFKINTIKGSYTDNQSHTWQTAFTSAVFAVLVTGGQDVNGSFQYYNLDNLGCDVSFDGSGTKAYSVVALGV